MAARRHPPIEPGQVFGAWTVERVDLGPKGGVRVAHARCSCGTRAPLYPPNLVRGLSTCCGECGRQRAAQTNRDRLGYDRVMADPVLRDSWLNRFAAILARCHNPECVHWPNYGGRGIHVHPPWREDTARFLRFIQRLEGWDDLALSVDRIDNDRGYEPGNLRMATQAAQMRNTRAYRGGGTEGKCEWCGRAFLRKRWFQRFCGKPCSGRASHVRPAERGAEE